MSSEMSVARVLAKLEARAAVHREQQAFHAQKEAHHREQRELHEAELEKVNANLETFRAAAATAVDLATQPAAESPSSTSLDIRTTELESAPEAVQAKFEEILELGPDFLEVTEEALALAAGYAEHGALPPKFQNDMLHIALATVADVDVLVSWNFKHIVRLAKIRLFNAVHIELGYKQIQIFSPREVTTHE